MTKGNDSEKNMDRLSLVLQERVKTVRAYWKLRRRGQLELKALKFERKASRDRINHPAGDKVLPR